MMFRGSIAERLPEQAAWHHCDLDVTCWRTIPEVPRSAGLDLAAAQIAGMPRSACRFCFYIKLKNDQVILACSSVYANEWTSSHCHQQQLLRCFSATCSFPSLFSSDLNTSDSLVNPASILAGEVCSHKHYQLDFTVPGCCLIVSCADADCDDRFAWRLHLLWAYSRCAPHSSDT